MHWCANGCSSGCLLQESDRRLPDLDGEFLYVVAIVVPGVMDDKESQRVEDPEVGRIDRRLKSSRNCADGRRTVGLDNCRDRLRDRKLQDRAL